MLVADVELVKVVPAAGRYLLRRGCSGAAVDILEQRECPPGPSVLLIEDFEFLAPHVRHPQGPVAVRRVQGQTHRRQPQAGHRWVGRWTPLPRRLARIKHSLHQEPQHVSVEVDLTSLAWGTVAINLLSSRSRPPQPSTASGQDRTVR
jgi:hypothetical protein